MNCGAVRTLSSVIEDLMVDDPAGRRMHPETRSLLAAALRIERAREAALRARPADEDPDNQFPA